MTININRVMKSQDQEYRSGKPEPKKKRDLEKKRTWKRKGSGKENGSMLMQNPDNKNSFGSVLCLPELGC